MSKGSLYPYYYEFSRFLLPRTGKIFHDRSVLYVIIEEEFKRLDGQGALEHKILKLTVLGF